MSIERSEVMHRAATIWPLYGVQYSQGALRNGWRTDCSGYVSMCLDLTGVGWGGANTVTFVTGGYAHEITQAELLAGDMIGHCGPGTEGDGGHIVLFDRWQDSTHAAYWAYEMTGGWGPKHRIIQYPYDGVGGDWKPYRYAAIDGGGPPLPGGQWVSVRPWPDPPSTIGGIAEHFGIADWHLVWNAAENAGLRAHRVVPEHIQPGDAVWVPAH